MKIEVLLKLISETIRDVKKTLLHFLVSVILVLLFETADCARLLSELGHIKTTDRNRLHDILNDLLLIYDANPCEKELIDIRKLAEKLAGQWNKG